MPDLSYNFDHVERLTVGTIGPIGQRTFYLQAHVSQRRISLTVEKEQVQALADALDRLLDEVVARNPLLPTADDLLMPDMTLEVPLESLFKVVQMGLGYEAETDLVVLVIQGQVKEEEDPVLVRFAFTRLQARALGNRATELIAVSRPTCGNCGRPIEQSGHFCPERNGHGPGKSPSVE